MIQAGILSDTHLMSINKTFLNLVEDCFADCDTIIHAGDLTNLTLLDVFADKTVFAVHGNMCGNESYASLPSQLSFKLGNYTFGLTHGAGHGHDAERIESVLPSIFPKADCLIYGHTHVPACHRVGDKIIINPGSFQIRARYGGPGSYAILEIDEQLHAKIHQIPQR